MIVPERARLVRIPLEADAALDAAAASLLVRGDEHPAALAGDWAGGGALVASEPLLVAGADEDPFDLLDRQPVLDAAAAGTGVGGGWFGYLGYGLGARLERVPPSPPRAVPLPDFGLAFYDHLLRLDAGGRWWFEALWTDARADVLRTRLEQFRARLTKGVRERPVWVGAFEPAAPGAAGHMAAIDECRERIAAGEIFQANLCLRLEAGWSGDPLDLFARGVRELGPRHAAMAAGPWGAVCSFSPELFLRRRGREVTSEPIKGTAPRGVRDDAAPAELVGSAKDRAENVMIVDLMRNDLGRVCEYGSVHVPSLAEPRPAPGVWHLVSTVRGALRPGAGDADLLRASFPPGSVTGAPKIRAMRVIAELEAGGREAYTGAVGYASPAAGLELNVAIRTLEMRGERIWIGAGGGIVAESEAGRELEECFVKARPVIAAVGGSVVERPPAPRVAPIRALAGDADRPDPSLGVFETLLVRDGVPVELRAHLARLERSVRELYGSGLPTELASRVVAAAAAAPLQRIRVLACPDDAGELIVEVEAAPPAGAPAAEPGGPEPVALGAEPVAPGSESVALGPAVLPGGLGAHKWRDRRLIDELERRLGAVPLIFDLDGHVLEAGYANVFVVEGNHLITPPLDGRQLAGTVRARVLALHPAREEPVSLDRLAAADEILLASSVRGVHPAHLAGSPATGFELGARLRAALDEDARGAVAR